MIHGDNRIKNHGDLIQGSDIKKTSLSIKKNIHQHDVDAINRNIQKKFR